MTSANLSHKNEGPVKKVIIWPETRRAPITDQPDIEVSAVTSDLPTSNDSEQDQSIIDRDVLKMLKALQFPNDEEKFNDRIAISLEKVGSNLKKARLTLGRSDSRELEDAACELSKNALMIGAVNLMKGSYELQGCARRSDWDAAQNTINQLEVEYFRAQQGLKQSVR